MAFKAEAITLIEASMRASANFLEEGSYII